MVLNSLMKIGSTAKHSEGLGMLWNAQMFDLFSQDSTYADFREAALGYFGNIDPVRIPHQECREVFPYLQQQLSLS